MPVKQNSFTHLAVLLVYTSWMRAEWPGALQSILQAELALFVITVLSYMCGYCSDSISFHRAWQIYTHGVL
jgi:hypothetical protein